MGISQTKMKNIGILIYLSVCLIILIIIVEAQPPPPRGGKLFSINLQMEFGIWFNVNSMLSLTIFFFLNWKINIRIKEALTLLPGYMVPIYWWKVNSELMIILSHSEPNLEFYSEWNSHLFMNCCALST